MGASYLAEAAVFLITTVFSLYILLVMLRFLLQTVRADFYNPISQLLVRLTNPPLRHLRRWIPGYAGIDWSILVFMLVLQLVELLLVSLVSSPRIPGPWALLVLSIASLLRLAINVYFFSIIIQIIMSWVNPGAYNPVTVILYKLNNPLLRPARRLIPPFSGLDFSPMAVLIALRLLDILVAGPLFAVGAGLAQRGF